jgi:hypothetical protein
MFKGRATRTYRPSNRERVGGTISVLSEGPRGPSTRVGAIASTQKPIKRADEQQPELIAAWLKTEYTPINRRALTERRRFIGATRRV